MFRGDHLLFLLPALWGDLAELKKFDEFNFYISEYFDVPVPASSVLEALAALMGCPIKIVHIIYMYICIYVYLFTFIPMKNSWQ